MASTPVVDEQPARPALSRRTFLMLEVAVLYGLHLNSVVSGLIRPLRSSLYSNFLTPTVIVQIVGEVTQIALLLFVVFASGDSMSEFGFSRPKANQIQSLSASGILVLGLHYVFYGGFNPAGISHTPATFQTSLAPAWLLAILCISIGVTEELFFRGYLISRIEEITGSKWTALFSQAIFFAAVHTYEGWTGEFQAGLFGLIVGAVFLWRRNIWPLAIVHAAFDFAIIYRTYYLRS